MSIQLYRKGNSHRCRGIPCEIINITGDLEGHLKLGWILDPKELYKDPEPEEQMEVEPDALQEVEVEQEEIEKEIESEEEASEEANTETEEEVLTDEKDGERFIRADAKEAGIKKWHVKSIKRLKEELEGLENVRTEG